jgi:molybdopterin-guanine dinucleotide biosynthesis protein A
MSYPSKKNITAVILAGGRGRRLGGQDKGLLELNDKPLIEHILDAVKPQVKTVIINANRNLDVYTDYAYPVVSDDMTDFQGPLAGFAAALSACNTDYIKIV